MNVGLSKDIIVTSSQDSGNSSDADKGLTQKDLGQSSKWVVEVENVETRAIQEEATMDIGNETLHAEKFQKSKKIPHVVVNVFEVAHQENE